MLISKRYFLRKAHSTEQTPFTWVFQSGTHLSAKSTEAMQIKCMAQVQHPDSAGIRTFDRCILQPPLYPHEQYAP